MTEIIEPSAGEFGYSVKMKSEQEDDQNVVRYNEACQKLTELIDRGRTEAYNSLIEQEAIDLIMIKVEFESEIWKQEMITLNPSMKDEEAENLKRQMLFSDYTNNLDYVKRMYDPKHLYWIERWEVMRKEREERIKAEQGDDTQDVSTQSG